MAARKIALMAFALTIGTALPTNAYADDHTSLSFGVVPQQSASRLARIWLPILEKLSQKSGYNIKFATAKDIPTFEACLAHGAYDIAYMNPYHYVVFSDVSGYRAIGRQQDHRLRGLLVTRKDSPIETLDDLDGQEVAFPSPAAFGASVIPRAEIAARGITISENYVNSHDSVYMAVANGLTVAGGGVKRTWKTIPDTIRDQLRVFYQTDPYSPHAFAVQASLTEDQAATLGNALTALDADTLSPLGMKGIEAAIDTDWDDIRGLGLTKKDTGVVVEDSNQCHSD
ncbi:phosphate/phosphite/phosphonate ABC transporter substrate-binding protein [Thalassospira sp. HF15]|uniref:PhnD/SsuA/transferrin family substrate-binding protein n=1 Tax=Thalassospira sp. HF15 TaxID=2722755 RepID=UPI00142FE7BC|nr:PhnD/SsuA/transferrin family substrate-binding protein [Thalassospira sp. HF15]NIY75055.1 phosphate/phosphite/phosphonate ABC transporter substrate-binding protein [Thalassospira sp. HF15]